MTKSFIIVMSVTFSTIQIAFADCANSSIPGYYVDRYLDKKDGTIVDSMTNLMWMKCDVHILWNANNQTCQHTEESFGSTVPVQRIEYTWQEALSSASNINTNGFAGFTDWRLPNIKELSSILAIHCLNDNQSEPALNTQAFDGEAAFYWSSTPSRNEIPTLDSAPAINQAWQVSFRSGSVLGARPVSIDNPMHVRLVRNNSQ